MQNTINKPHFLLRTLNLPVILGNVLYNYMYITSLFREENGTYTSPDFFNYSGHASYTLCIWMLAQLSFIIYAGVQLFPSQRHNSVYDKMAGPLLAANVLNILWTTAMMNRQNVISFALLFMMLVAGAFMFFRVHKKIALSGRSNWHTLPFALFFGWATLISFDNLACHTCLAVAFCAGMIIGFSRHDAVYPAIIAFGGIAVWLTDTNLDHSYTAPALASGIVLLASSAVIAFRYLYKQRLSTSY